MEKDYDYVMHFGGFGFEKYRNLQQVEADPPELRILRIRMVSCFLCKTELAA